MNYIKLLGFIGKKGTMIMPLGVIIGLFSPTLSELSKPLATPLVLLMLVVSIYRLDPTQILVVIRRFKVIVSGTIWIIVVMPFFIFFVAKLIDLPADLLIILIAWSACPPLVSMPGLAILIGLDGTAALLILIGATLLFTLSLPAILVTLTGTEVGLDPISMSLHLASIVGICTIIAQCTRWSVGKSIAKLTEPAADGIIVILMALFAVTIMGGIHATWDDNQSKVILFFLTATGACIISQTFCALIFSNFHRPTAGTIALASGSRNLALLIPVAGGVFAENLWLYLAVVQIPVYFLPLLAKPLYRNFYLDQKL